MLLFPAIDLMNGEVVRLRQGRADQKTVYSSDAPAFAKRWETEGGDWLHIVDLDAAFSGEFGNLDAVKAIVNAVEIPCELGGGMRSLAAVDKALATGVARVVVGTKAAESPEFVSSLIKEFGAERIAVGIDAKDGEVSLRGWTSGSGVKATALAKQMAALGVRTLIYTDIATDGMLTGPNIPALNEMLEATGGELNLIASGGVGTADDVRKLQAIPGIHGAIIGKALYDGAFTLREVAAQP
ncbi:MAG TPA: 1-(5-phosphoribosyl)-5-[(5-phosphoribosylamino)methylideneamino]imidazole-4-carboxamide isomerase [Chthoniobacterales bacterium]